jgi:hypothetical protein
MARDKGHKPSIVDDTLFFVTSLKINHKIPEMPLVIDTLYHHIFRIGRNCSANRVEGVFRFHRSVVSLKLNSSNWGDCRPADFAPNSSQTAFSTIRPGMTACNGGGRNGSFDREGDRQLEPSDRSDFKLAIVSQGLALCIMR